MKVDELRKILNAHKKEEIIKIAVELYKLVPKAKKEDYDLDGMIQNIGDKPKAVKAAPKATDLSTLEGEVKCFVENVRAQNYLRPNRAVPKKERSTWRFQVKRWCKELTAGSATDPEVGRKAKIIRDLYEVLSESCAFQYFTAYDTFESVGVSQIDFYHSVLTLSRAALDPGDFITVAINTLVKTELNRYTLYSNLMVVFIGFLPIPDMKNRAIETARRLLEVNGYNPNAPKKKSYSFFADREEYKQKDKNNNLAELVLRIHITLHEYDEGIEYFNRRFHQRDAEVKLYVLVRILHHHEAFPHILREIDAARARKVRPRKALQDAYDEIKATGSYTGYF